MKTRFFLFAHVYIASLSATFVTESAEKLMSLDSEVFWEKSSDIKCRLHNKKCNREGSSRHSL